MLSVSISHFDLIQIPENSKSKMDYLGHAHTWPICFVPPPQPLNDLHSLDLRTMDIWTIFGCTLMVKHITKSNVLRKSWKVLNLKCPKLNYSTPASQTGVIKCLLIPGKRRGISVYIIHVESIQPSLDNVWSFWGKKTQRASLSWEMAALVYWQTVSGTVHLLLLDTKAAIIFIYFHWLICLLFAQLLDWLLI